MKKLISILIILLILAVVGISGCTDNTTSSPKEFQVGNSTFKAPSDYNVNETFNGSSDEVFGKIKLTSGNKSIEVFQFHNEINMKNIIFLLYPTNRFKETNTSIANVSVRVFKLGTTQAYFFQKNGKFYDVEIYANDSKNETITMIISSIN